MVDIILEAVRALVLLGIVIFLVSVGGARLEANRKGWNLIVAGFGLLLFGSLLDITDNFEALNNLVVVGDTEVEAFLEKFVGFLGGFVLLAVGLILWIPSVHRMALEVSNRKRAEEELRASQSRLSDAIESISEAFVLFDADERLIVCNSKYREQFSTVADLLMPGARLEDLYRAAAARGHIAEAIGNEEAWIQDRLQRSRTAKGTREEQASDGRWVLINERKTQEGGTVSVRTDITDVKQAEERLRQAQKIEAVGQLTGGVAHDFNNLLAVIQGNAELLQMDGGAKSSLVAPILRATARGSELTQRLLAFSRQQPLRPQTIDLGGLVTGMANPLARVLGATVEVESRAGPDLWTAKADPGQVENALLNLVINARDAMPEGGKLTIECLNTHLDAAYVADNPEAVAGDYVLLSVTDSGTGMPAEIKARAFEPFYTTKEVGQGSGLGLSMIFGFAKQSGGYVSIHSEVGKGTSVKLYLPRSQAASKGTRSRPAETPPRGHDETVLVVEDDSDVLALAVRMLEDLGYRVIDAPEAATAREVLAEGQRVDLVLSDVVLPGGISGPELADEVRVSHPELPIIFMSGYPAEAAKRNGFLGSDSVLLSKPFSRHELATALREALG